MWTVIIVVALAVGVIVKRFVGEPLRARELFAPPLILTGLGVHSLANDLHPDGRDLAWIATASVVGLAMGALRGLTPRLFPRDGHLWQRYTLATLGVWVLSIAVNLGIDLLATAAGTPGEARPTTLAIGAGLLGEALVLGWRALASGTPFAPNDDRLSRRAVARR